MVSTVRRWSASEAQARGGGCRGGIDAQGPCQRHFRARSNGAHKITGCEFIVTLNAETMIEGAQLENGQLYARIEGKPYGRAIQWKLGARGDAHQDATGKSAVQIARLQGSYRLNHGGIDGQGDRAPSARRRLPR